MWCHAEVLNAVAQGDVTRSRRGQWLPDWNVDGSRIDFWVRRLDDRCLIDAPARDLPTMEDAGQAVLDLLRDGRDLPHLTWKP